MGLPTFSLDLTLDGCTDHRKSLANEETHLYFTRLLDEAGWMLWGCITNEMMESCGPGIESVT